MLSVGTCSCQQFGEKADILLREKTLQALHTQHEQSPPSLAACRTNYAAHLSFAYPMLEKNAHHFFIF